MRRRWKGCNYAGKSAAIELSWRISLAVSTSLLLTKHHFIGKAARCAAPRFLRIFGSCFAKLLWFGAAQDAWTLRFALMRIQRHMAQQWALTSKWQQP
jgi:hypothetical protein